MSEASLSAQGWRFVMLGAGNTLVTYALFVVLLRWLTPQPAFALVYLVGILVAYVGNSQWVFGSALTWRSALAYPVLYLIVYAVTALGLHLLVSRWHCPAWLAMAVCLTYSVPLSFVLNRALFAWTGSRRR